MRYYKIEIIKGYIATIEANSKKEAKKIAADLCEKYGQAVIELSYTKKA